MSSTASRPVLSGSIATTPRAASSACCARANRLRSLVLALCNFTPVPRDSYRLGVPRGGFWREALNSDAVAYGGSGIGNRGGLDAEPVAHHGRPFSLVLTLPPLSVSFFVNQP